MVKQIELPAHTLDSTIVQDGISAIHRFSKQTEIPAYISGGMAVQVYLPVNLRRESIDLDFNSLICSNKYTDYQEKTSLLVTHLFNKGYEISFKQRDTTFDYNIKKDDDTLLIQHAKRSPNNFTRCLKSFRREVDNSREFQYSEGVFRAVAPEDISVKKANRIMRFIKQYNLDFPSEQSLNVRKEQADLNRKNILSHLSDESPENLGRSIAKLRTQYDCFDIQALGQYGNIDKKYLTETIKSWEGHFSQLDYNRILGILGF